jgi:hypothetical protein
VADNVAITAGSGTSVATDERTINSTAVQVQRVAPHGTPNATMAQVTVTNSTTVIAAARDTRHSIVIVNKQPVSVFINDTTATTSDFELEPGASITLFSGAAINGITTAAYSGSTKVHYWENHD